MEVNIFITYITLGPILMMFFGTFVDAKLPRYHLLAKIIAVTAFEIVLILLAIVVVMKTAKV